MKNLVLAGLGSLTLVGAASAAPTGLYWEFSTVTVGNQDFCVGRLYICYSNPLDTLLNVYNANFQLTGGEFNHNDLATNGQNANIGSWSPNNFFPPFIGNPAIDSYVTIGGQTSSAALNSNTTQNDPSFQAGANFVKGGWFNSNPPNLQGRAKELPGQPGWYTLIGQFVVLGEFAQTASLSVFFFQTTNQGIGTPIYPQTSFSGVFGWSTGPIPAPGALALLGLAGLAGGRRRRA